TQCSFKDFSDYQANKCIIYSLKTDENLRNTLLRHNLIEKLIIHESLQKNTKPELIFSNILPAVSILLSPGTVLKVTPLSMIAKKKKIGKLVFQDFTKAGLLKALGTTSGCMLWASDEFGPILSQAVGTNDCEWRGFRSILNNFYSGCGLTKAFACKEAAEVDSVFFSIAGSTQPHPFCNLLEKITSTTDGLEDRFLQISATPYMEERMETANEFPDLILRRQKDWPTVALSF
uniref:Uncharacterized protein n=1 Tax=Romanomermis culicivorax TaxID=13658 RepID=A0A915IKA4_ROMCU